MNNQSQNAIDIVLAESLKELAATKPIEKITIKERYFPIFDFCDECRSVRSYFKFIIKIINLVLNGKCLRISRARTIIGRLIIICFNFPFVTPASINAL